MTEAELTRDLEALAAGGFALPPGREAFPLLLDHLPCLGALEPRLRDGLFYEAADAWIGRGLLAQGQLTLLAARLLSPEFLFLGIGEREGTDVFRRTFSALVLDSIVRRWNAAEAADPTALEAIALGLERYAREEQDLRGFVPPFGWAHSVAHAADVLASLMASTALHGREDRLLEATRLLLLRSPCVYTHQEDKRLARVLVAHRRRHPAQQDRFEAWIDGVVSAHPVSYSTMEDYARSTNVLGLLRALFFHLHRDPAESGTAAWLEDRVRRLMRIP